MSWSQSFYVLGFALLLLMLGAGWWLYTVRAAARKNRETSWYVEALRDQFPEAFEVLSRFDQNRGLAKLAEADPDLGKAVDVIKQYARQGQPQKPTRGLKIISPDSTPETSSTTLKAALVTIVRGIYSNPDDVESLGEGGQEALDAFLGSLVD